MTRRRSAQRAIILRLLSQNPGEVVRTSQIQSELQAEGFIASLNTIRVQIYRLRHREGIAIQHVYGVGYALGDTKITRRDVALAALQTERQRAEFTRLVERKQFSVAKALLAAWGISHKETS